MGDFVTGRRPLPPPKVDAFPPQGVPGELDASDINDIWGALDDVRTGIGFPNRTVVSDTDYSVVPTDFLISFTQITAQRTVTLPAASAGLRQIIIKDESGSASEAIPISVVAQPGETVDGTASPAKLVVVITHFGSAALYSNGVEWRTLYKDIGYIVGPGALPRSLDSMVLQTTGLDVRSYGAKGDGVTDDTAAINAAIAAGVATGVPVRFPNGTYIVTSMISVDADRVEIIGYGPTQTIIKYTGGAAAAVFRIGSATPLVTQRQGIRLDSMTIRGNANVTDVLLIQGVFRSYFSRLSLMDATQSGLHTLWCVVNTFQDIHVSGLDFQGNFLVQPAIGLLFDAIDLSHKTTASTVIDPVVEGVSGSGIKLAGAANMVFTGGTSEWNARGIEMAFGSDSTQNVFVGMDLEQNSVADIEVGTATNQFLGMLSAGLTHLVNGAQGCVFTGGFYKDITINSGALANSFDVTFNNGTFSDSGVDTKITRLLNSGSAALQGIPWTSRDTIPAAAYTGIWTPDKQDTLTGDYTIAGTTQTQLSNTAYTGTVWRVIFVGTWSNNQEGGALAQVAPFIEATSAAPTFAIGSVTVTVSRDGSGHFQLANGNVAHYVGFSGRVYVVSYLNGAAGTASMLLKGKVTAGGLVASGGQLSPSTDALAAQGNGLFQGSGVPSNGNGNNGDFYFRTDAPANANQRLYVKSAGSWVAMLMPGARVVLTYSATIATDASLGDSFEITATNGTAFTISNPTNLTTGQTVRYVIRNTSGGAHGLITWGATFKTAAAALAVTTAFSKTIEFLYNGTNLVEQFRGAADVAN